MTAITRYTTWCDSCGKRLELDRDEYYSEDTECKYCGSTEFCDDPPEDDEDLYNCSLCDIDEYSDADPGL